MARVKQDLRDDLARAHLFEVLEEDRIYPTLPVAVEAFEAWQADRAEDGTPDGGTLPRSPASSA